jgi:hypothetical protein
MIFLHHLQFKKNEHLKSQLLEWVFTPHLFTLKFGLRYANHSILIMDQYYLLLTAHLRSPPSSQLHLFLNLIFNFINQSQMILNF